MQATEFSELNNFLNNQKRQLTPAVFIFISDLHVFSLEIDIVSGRARRFVKRLGMVRSSLDFNFYMLCRGNI